MSFLEDLIAKAFRKDSRGRLTLAPYGPRGKVYVVPPDRVKKYTRFMSRFYASLAGAIVLGALIFGTRVLVGVIIPAFVGFSFIYMRRFTRDLEVGTDVPLGNPRDWLTPTARETSTRPTVPRGPTSSVPAITPVAAISPVPAILVSRRPRGEGDGWSNARSWLGGRPQLGSIPWPRAGAKQVPLTHVAWIDLAHLSERVSYTPLPRAGAMAFFIGEPEERAQCAVLHIADVDTRDTDPPVDAPPAYTPYGGVFATADTRGSRIFPRWPVELTSLEPRTPQEEEDPGIVVDRYFARRDFFFDTSAVRQTLGDMPLPTFWQSGHHLAACLQSAVEKIETLRAQRVRYGAAGDSLVAFDAGRPAFLEFVGEVERFVSDRAPQKEMTLDEVERLRSYFARAKNEFASYAKVWTPISLKELETAALRSLASAEDDALWAALPSPVRTLLDRNYLLPTGGWHQMFGAGLDIQGTAVDEHAADHLLLQLVYDDLMEWNFGDMGVYQFWLNPVALQQGRWSAAQVTFEAH